MSLVLDTPLVLVGLGDALGRTLSVMSTWTLSYFPVVKPPGMNPSLFLGVLLSGLHDGAGVPCFQDSLPILCPGLRAPLPAAGGPDPASHP